MGTLVNIHLKTEETKGQRLETLIEAYLFTAYFPFTQKKKTKKPQICFLQPG